ncbi:hypothetical protein NQ314_015605 [Rhamnusium bicolor]|uniref:PiggyBac transposable element-derived protein domain-containing protein n=1 Tax=Rhamnusium bicolor TaxID=1586634 RepID=A0AAV8WZ98_9CUCU|nr:hypothetical protein NQ314_015605 [Rhamnusium bicolor]
MSEDVMIDNKEAAYDESNAEESDNEEIELEDSESKQDILFLIEKKVMYLRATRFREKCSFRQHIPSKPNKYGLKIYALFDAKMYCTSQIKGYVGKQSPGPFNSSTSANDIVLRLIDNIRTTSRNLTIENWFTLIPLIEE